MTAGVRVCSSASITTKCNYTCFFSYYGKQWVESQGGILDLLEIELPPEPAKPEKVFTAVLFNRQ